MTYTPNNTHHTSTSNTPDALLLLTALRCAHSGSPDNFWNLNRGREVTHDTNMKPSLSLPQSHSHWALTASATSSSTHPQPQWTQQHLSAAYAASCPQPDPHCHTNTQHSSEDRTTTRQSLEELTNGVRVKKPNACQEEGLNALSGLALCAQIHDTTVPTLILALTLP